MSKPIEIDIPGELRTIADAVEVELAHSKQLTDLINIAVAAQRHYRAMQKHHWQRYHDPLTSRSMLQNLANDSDRMRKAADAIVALFTRRGWDCSQFAGEEFLREVVK